jgi:hypothetical protein
LADRMLVSGVVTISFLQAAQDLLKGSAYLERLRVFVASSMSKS